MEQRVRRCWSSLCSEECPGEPISRMALRKSPIGRLAIPGCQGTNDCVCPGRLLTFASDLNLPASIAFLALAAAATGCARYSVPEFAGRAGSTFSRKHSYTVSYRTIPVACSITIEAQMGGHAAPPSLLAILISNRSSVKSCVISRGRSCPALTPQPNAFRPLARPRRSDRSFRLRTDVSEFRQLLRESREPRPD